MYGLTIVPQKAGKALFFSVYVLCINIEEEVTQKAYETHSL